MNIAAKTLTAGALALALTASSIGTAEAGRHGGRFAAGVVTGVVAGALLYGLTRPHDSVTYYGAEPEPYCYRGPRQCASHWNCWTDYYGRETCRRDVSCSRPLICE